MPWLSFSKWLLISNKGCGIRIGSTWYFIRFSTLKNSAVHVQVDAIETHTVSQIYFHLINSLKKVNQKFAFSKISCWVYISSTTLISKVLAIYERSIEINHWSKQNIFSQTTSDKNHCRSRSEATKGAWNSLKTCSSGTKFKYCWGRSRFVGFIRSSLKRLWKHFFKFCCLDSKQKKASLCVIKIDGFLSFAKRLVDSYLNVRTRCVGAF